MVGGGGHAVMAEFCADKNVTYANRVDDPDGWNWCLVPDGGFDAVLFAGLAICAMCLASPRWDALIVLLFGGIYEALAFSYNLEHVSNAVALWLGMRPADIFVYVFLPPFLLDLAVRIDYFMLKKVAFNIVFMAFVMVAMSALLFIPFMLYALDLKSSGWTAGYVALFGAMIASTDAAAVSAVLRGGGAPEILSVILEGECLFNDASSLTLFEIFKDVVESEEGSTLGQDISGIVTQTLWSAFTGICIGVAFGIFTRWVFSWLQHRNMGAHAEVAWSVAGAYLTFYITQVWCHGSGCIASVAFGLYGSATLLWGMSTKARQKGTFLQFWEVITFIINGLIFFYVGASSVNFTRRATTSIYGDSGGIELVKILLYKLPLIYLMSFVMRAFFLFASFWLLKKVRLSDGLSWQEIVFVTMGGLRGSLSLVLAQSIATLASSNPVERRVKAEIAIYTAGYVMFTLLINAPVCGPLMTLLGLDRIRTEQLAMRTQVKSLFHKFTNSAMLDLQAEQDDDELLQGLDWATLQKHTDFTQEFAVVLPERQPHVVWCDCGGIMEDLLFVPRLIAKYVGRCCYRAASNISSELSTRSMRNPIDRMKDHQDKEDLRRTTQWNVKDLAHVDSKHDHSPHAIIIRSMGSAGASPATSASMGRSGSSRRVGLPGGSGRTRSLRRMPSSLGFERTSSRDIEFVRTSANRARTSNTRSLLDVERTKNSDDAVADAPTVFSPTAPAPAQQDTAAQAAAIAEEKADLAQEVGNLDHIQLDVGDMQYAAHHGGHHLMQGMHPAYPTPAEEQRGTGEHMAGQPGLANAVTSKDGPAINRGSHHATALDPNATVDDSVPLDRTATANRTLSNAYSGMSGDDAIWAAMARHELEQQQQDNEQQGKDKEQQQSEQQALQAQPDEWVKNDAGPNDDGNMDASLPLPPAGFAANGVRPNPLAKASSLVDLPSGLFSPSNPPSSWAAGGSSGPPSIAPSQPSLARDDEPSSSSGHAGRQLTAVSSSGWSQMDIYSPGSKPNSTGGSLLQKLLVIKPGSTSGHANGSSHHASLHGSSGHPHEAGVRLVQNKADSSLQAIKVEGRTLGRSSVRALARSSTNSGAQDGSLHGSTAAGEALRSPPSPHPGMSRHARSLSGNPKFQHQATDDSLESTHSGGPRSPDPRANPSGNPSGKGGSERPLGRSSVGAGSTGRGLGRSSTTARVFSDRDSPTENGPAKPRDRVTSLRIDPDAPLARNSSRGNGTTPSGNAPLGRNSQKGQRGLSTQSVNVARVFDSLAEEPNSDGDNDLSPRKRADATGRESIQRRTRFANIDPHDTRDLETGLSQRASEQLTHAAVQPLSSDGGVGHNHKCPQMLLEYRVRLLTGLKQYYKQRHAAGVLSPSSYKVLSYVADQSLHHPDQPLELWHMVKQEVSSSYFLQLEASTHFKLKNKITEARQGNNPLKTKLAEKFLMPWVWLISKHMSAVTLSGLETAVELWASLTQSLQTQWLEYSGAFGEKLLDEVHTNADEAWKYVIERRIEVPEKFSAIQTHRTTIELLSQQETFVREMNEGGMIEEGECRKMVDVIERRLQMLARGGPVWRQPSVKDILANAAFLRGCNPKLVDWIRHNSHMRVYEQGALIWQQKAEPNGIIVVIHGVVRMMVEQQGMEVPLYLGSGGVGGLIAAVMTENVPGVSMVAAYAEGNALGKGPLVLHVPWQLLQVIQRFSREEGLAPYQALELQLYRTASAYVLDLLRSQVTHQLGLFVRTSLALLCSAERGEGMLARRQRIRGLLQASGQDHFDLALDWIGELLALPADKARALVVPWEVEEVDPVVEGLAAEPWVESMYKAVASATSAVYDVIKAALKESALMVLHPGQAMVQRSTMVLIQGALEAPGSVLSTSTGTGTMDEPPPIVEAGNLMPRGHFVASSNEQHVAPSVMVWVSDYFEGDLLHQEPVRVVAGPKGATLMVWGVDPEDLLEDVE